MMSRQKKIWELPEWKATRKRLLKDYCEQCETTDKISVLTHLKPFPKALQIKQRVIEQLIHELLVTHKINEFQPTCTPTISVCPNCSSTSLRQRKVKLPKYICNRCKHEFEQPAIEVERRTLNQLQHEYYRDALQPYQDEIDKRYNEEQTRLKEYYLSGEDTITLCTTCSYNFKMGRVLCKFCKKHYHSKHYDKCFYCNSVKCEKCDNRILKSKNQTICDDCQTIAICPICKKNPVANGLKLCENCILQGQWID